MSGLSRLSQSRSSIPSHLASLLSPHLLPSLDPVRAHRLRKQSLYLNRHSNLTNCCSSSIVHVGGDSAHDDVHRPPHNLCRGPCFDLVLHGDLNGVQHRDDRCRSRLNSFVKTVVPGAGFVGGGETSLERVLLHLREGPSGMELVSIEVRTGRGASSAVFLSVGPSLITVGFGSSEQLLSRGFSFRHDGGEGGRGKGEKEGEEAGKHA
jgi:hypothetical protein